MTPKIFFRWVAWLLLIAVAVFTLTPIEFRPFTKGPFDNGTIFILERFAAFAVIGVAFCLGYPKHRLGMLLFLIGAAGLLEVTQNFVPGRHGDLTDGFLKALGAVAGTAFATVVGRYKRDP